MKKIKKRTLLLVAGIIGIIILCVGYFIFIIGGKADNPKFTYNNLSESANIIITDEGFSQEVISLKFSETTPALIKVSNESSQIAEIDVIQPNREDPLISLKIPANEQYQFVIEVFGSFIVTQRNTNNTLNLDVVQE